MSSERTIYVDCPCCNARIEARSEDGRVVQHWAKPKTGKPSSGDPLKDALEKLKADKEKRDRYMANPSAILEEQKRKARDRFEAEKKRVAEEGDTSRPPSPFDND